MQLFLIIWFNYCIFQTKNENYSNIFELDKGKLSILINGGCLSGLSMYLANHCESKKSFAPFAPVKPSEACFFATSLGVKYLRDGVKSILLPKIVCVSQLFKVGIGKYF